MERITLRNILVMLATVLMTAAVIDMHWISNWYFLTGTIEGFWMLTCLVAAFALGFVGLLAGNRNRYLILGLAAASITGLVVGIWRDNYLLGGFMPWQVNGFFGASTVIHFALNAIAFVLAIGLINLISLQRIYYDISYDGDGIDTDEQQSRQEALDTRRHSREYGESAASDDKTGLRQVS